MTAVLDNVVRKVEQMKKAEQSKAEHNLARLITLVGDMKSTDPVMRALLKLASMDATDPAYLPVLSLLGESDTAVEDTIKLLGGKVSDSEPDVPLLHTDRPKHETYSAKYVWVHEDGQTRAIRRDDADFKKKTDELMDQGYNVTLHTNGDLVLLKKPEAIANPTPAPTTTTPAAKSGTRLVHRKEKATV